MKLYIHATPNLTKHPSLLNFSKKHEAHSFVWGFLALFDCLSQQLVTWVLCTDGLTHNITPVHGTFSYSVGPGEDNCGLIVGTGSTPPQPNDYIIGTKINHGNSAGQLAYQAQNFTSPWVATPNIYSATHRIFINNSGAPITVHEIALYVSAWSGGIWYRVCAAHDILAAPATIQAGQAYRFIYTFCTPVG